ncbi:MAG: ATP-binding protein [Candidatus Kapaibacterium sp.]|nr:MAG: ATP-binding protein [Candidatus Kapabacteria bacterium]
MIALQVEQVGHHYGKRPIFEEVRFSLELGDVLACVGRNGSGKSTLLRIIAGLLTPSAGTVTLLCDGTALTAPEWRRLHSGYCAPAVALYDELTVDELARFHAACRGIEPTALSPLLEESGLADISRASIGELSSGMVQRLKLALAFAGSPALIILDEPSTNLDQRGIATLHKWIERARKDAIIIIATNLETELPWCNCRYDLEARTFSHAWSNARALADHE